MVVRVKRSDSVWMAMLVKQEAMKKAEAEGNEDCLIKNKLVTPPFLTRSAPPLHLSSMNQQTHISVGALIGKSSETIKDLQINSAAKNQQLGKLKFALVFLAVLVMATCCHGSRKSIQGFQVKPDAMRNPGYFLGFLPKAMPIPPSAPSKQHNSFGLDSGGAP
ncbi:hypothetical protein J5N97_012000 [Dioscorea zingiberensis]|uniref:Uncharacterized protein n=1 Tax=Dioscorea zingiberensis TaxID=325984 RepID=A0A9D5CNA5_9LILI|nr:hypothetical protein J5N97_012000 [Dioscorea zingiberensis]